MQFLHQIFIKVISIIAGLIIALGIVEMPLSQDYLLPQKKAPKEEAPKEIIEIQKQPEAAPLPKSETLEARPPPTPPKLPPTPTPKPSAATTPSPAPMPPTIPLTELNKKVRSTVVNILCTTQIGGSFQPTTGSGIIIGSKGIILTTSHIGQYFLLENEHSIGNLDCIIRTGDIASPAYDAKLLYIPSIWVEKNAENVTQEEPKGTGEDDFAFLLIDKSLVPGKELPLSFSFSEMNSDFDNLPPDLSVLLASYPAGFLGGISIQKELGLTSTFAQIKKLFTFSEKEPTLDLFSLGGNIVAQGGSSGGAVIDIRDGKLIGSIVTSTTGTTTATRELNAITLPHISRNFQKYTGQNLTTFLTSDLESASALFSESEFNRLKNLLMEQLNKR